MRFRWLLALLIVLPWWSPALAGHDGRVVETMDAGGYTYVLLDTGSGNVWLAGPQTKVAVGEQIQCGQGLEMRDFASPSLGRTFESIWFVSAFEKGKAGTAGSPPHGEMMGHGHGGMIGQGHGRSNSAAADKPAAGSIPAAGVTVAEVYRDRKALEGKRVKVRGKVMKVNRGILGRNWLHVSDGTGEAGKDDLVVTSQQVAEVGSVVVVDGVVKTDLDLGSGYFFSVLLEEATVAP